MEEPSPIHTRRESAHFLSSVLSGPESAGQLARLLDALPCMLWTAAAGGAGQWFSSQWYRLTGQTEAEAAGDGWWQAIHPEEREQFLTAWRRAERAGDPYENEIRLRGTGSGRYCWHLVRAVPIFDDTGILERWFLVAVDIDPQTDSLGAHVRAIIESTAVGIVTTDEAGMIISFNPAAQQIFGCPASAITGRDVSTLFQVSERGELLAEIRRAAAQWGHGATAPLELEVRREDGSSFYVDVTVTEARYRNHALFGLIIRDATERRRTQAAIVEQEIRLRAVLESAVDVIITIDQKGTIQSVNRAIEKMFGYDQQEIIGRNVSTLMPEPHKSEHDSHLERYARTGDKRIIGVGREAMAQRKDGSPLPVFLSVGEMEIAGEKFYTGIIRDVSDLKKAHAKLLRTARLAALGEAITRLAHESRNFLQRIQTAVETASLDATEAQAAHLRQVELANEGLYQLLEEVRSYAAPIHLEISSVPLAELWRDAWSGLTRELRGRAAELEESIADDVPLVRVDRFRMTQVFRNLFENSLSATKSDLRISVRVEVVKQDLTSGVAGSKGATVGKAPAIRELRVSVQDNGPGLTPQQRERVFEPFFTTKARGTGLGMAIARRILDAHGGAIEAPRHEADGALFVLILPIDAVAPRPDLNGGLMP